VSAGSSQKIRRSATSLSSSCAHSLREYVFESRGAARMSGTYPSRLTAPDRGSRLLGVSKRWPVAHAYRRAVFRWAPQPCDTTVVIRTRREERPTPSPGEYSVVTWDDETGNAEILEYDSADRLVCRREWENYARPSGVDRVVGEVRSFDPAGEQTGVQPLKWRLAPDDDD
jgi:hypothetical protein